MTEIQQTAKAAVSKGPKAGLKWRVCVQVLDLAERVAINAIDSKITNQPSVAGQASVRLGSADRMTGESPPDAQLPVLAGRYPHAVTSLTV